MEAKANEIRTYTGVVSSPAPKNNSEIIHKGGNTVVITTNPGYFSVAGYCNSFDTFIRSKTFKTRAGADKFAARFLAGLR